MKHALKLYSITLATISLSLNAQTAKLAQPIASADLVFNEVNGAVTIEAEHFYKQSKNDLRTWYITSKNNIVQDLADPDEDHIYGASGNAYIEILPDTRVTPSCKLVKLEDPKLTEQTTKLVNFTDLPGRIAVVHYKININTPGRYYVWVRAHSTGPEDNSLHVGINNTWPENGQRMQWCDGKNSWAWASAQRTEQVHCGVPKQIFLNIDKPGIQDLQFSMREDGFEMDKIILTNNIDFVPKEEGMSPAIFKGVLPATFAKVEPKPVVPETAKKTYIEQIGQILPNNKIWTAKEFPFGQTKFYEDKDWLAINPESVKQASVSSAFPFATGSYDIIFVGVGENDGSSNYFIYVNDKLIGEYLPPLSMGSFEEAAQYNKLFEKVTIENGANFKVVSKIGSADGNEYSRGRWSGLVFVQAGKGAEVMEKSKSIKIQTVSIGAQPVAKKPVVLKDGNGTVAIAGELKQWHKVTLDLNGPFASETNKSSNPFSDYRMTVTFTHESGSPVYYVPAYFAADGKAGESGATEGSIWRAHLSPDKTGKWSYKISFIKGALAATADMPWMKELAPYNGIEGTFEVGATDKKGRDFRSKGRLLYTGKNHLQFAGTGEYFYKAGPDSPETMLAYEDFDNTVTMKPKVPVKKFTPHLQDFKEGDLTWKNGKGKGIIGAINYLAAKGLNSVSFLTYNAGGDGDNVWPFVSRNEKFNYDCSKLDQWQLVFDYAQSKGLYLHFKTQETENDDHFTGTKRIVKTIPEALDAGEMGPERTLYYRELIARFGYLLALNWNLGEENTQPTEVQQEMAAYFEKNDPYHHNVVLHTYPQDQARIYTPLLGNKSKLTGVSLQNPWDETFKQTLKWVTESNAAGRPWVVANDEQGGAGTGAVPDNGYKGFDPKESKYDMHDVRKQTLWGNIMAGGAGVEYYFGYKLAENDLLMEDYRSRDKSWDYCRIAINFLKDYKIPFNEMKNASELVGNIELTSEKQCLAKEGIIYLVQLAYVPTSTLDLTKVTGNYSVEWFDPVNGGKLLKGSVKTVSGGKFVDLGKAPNAVNQDWIILVKKKQ